MVINELFFDFLKFKPRATAIPAALAIIFIRSNFARMLLVGADWNPSRHFTHILSRQNRHSLFFVRQRYSAGRICEITRHRAILELLESDRRYPFATPSGKELRRKSEGSLPQFSTSSDTPRLRFVILLTLQSNRMSFCWFFPLFQLIFL